MGCPRGTCDHLELVHDWDEPGVEPICCVEGCSCGKGPMIAAGIDAAPRPSIPDCKQTSEVKP